MDGLVMRLKFVACLCMSLFMTGSAIAAESTDIDYCIKNVQNSFDTRYKFKMDKKLTSTKKDKDIFDSLFSHLLNYEYVRGVISKNNNNIDNYWDVHDHLELLRMLMGTKESAWSLNSRILLKLAVHKTSYNKADSKGLKNILLSESLYDDVLVYPQSSFMLVADNESFSEFNDNHNNELKLLKLIIKEDKNDLKFRNKNVDNENSNIKTYTASYLQEIYDKNEVKGDLKFKDKQFYVTGKIASIDSSLNDQPAIHFVTDSGNQFQTPTAFFNDYESKLDQIAELSKDDELTLLCIGGGEMVGSPMLKSCELPKSAVDTKVEEIVKNSSNDTELKGGYEPDNLYLSVRTIASVLPDDSACFNDDLDGCKNELINIPNYKIRSAANRYHLSSDKIHAAMRREINSVNKQQLDKYKNSKEIKEYIGFKERCYVPILMNLF